MTRVATVTVISEGNKVDPGYSLFSLEVNQQINKLASAEITYFDSKGYVGKFEISEDKVFKPGNKVKIQVRYEAAGSSDHTIFEGIIVGHKIKFNNEGALLILELRHYAILLTSTRNNIIYLDKTDKDIFSQIVKNYSDIKLSSKVKGGVKHTQMVQYNCTDWDFILSRAEANGWWLLSMNDDLVVSEPQSSAAKYILDLGADSKIYDLEMGLDISYQAASVEAVTWKVDNQNILTKTTKAEQGINLGAQVDPFKKALKGNGYRLGHIGNLTKEELKIWTQAKLAKNDFSLLKGRIKTEGLPEIMSGMTIELKSLTKYFNGKHIVSRVRHSIGLNGFRTELSIGLPNEGLIKSDEVQAPLAGGLLPAASGLQIGVVEGYEENPESKLLVKVRLPFFEGKSKTVMARLTSIYAGKERGVVFRPEPGDEVVLGFFNDDPRYPVVLGSMYSAKNTPPVEFTKENEFKAIVTREKLTLSLNDKDKAIIIESAENKVSITSGDKPEIDIVDKNKNNLSLSDKGISSLSKKDLILKADKSVTVQGNKVEIK